MKHLKQVLNDPQVFTQCVGLDYSTMLSLDNTILTSVVSREVVIMATNSKIVIFCKSTRLPC